MQIIKLFIISAIVLAFSTALMPEVSAAPVDVFNNCRTGVGTNNICEPTQGQNELFGQNGIFKRVINILLFLIGAIAVLMIIIGGLRYVLSAGDQSAVNNAKNTILYAVIGLAIAILAFAIVQFVIRQL